MEENAQITKIKKSCKVGKTVSKIMFIFCLIASISCLVAAIWIFSMGKDFDVQIQKAIDAGYVSTDSSFGSVSGININLGDPSSLHSDIPSCIRSKCRFNQSRLNRNRLIRFLHFNFLM